MSAHQDQVLGILAGHLGQFVRPGDGQVPIHPVGGDLHRDPAQILDQRQAQHDGDGPQFAQPQRGDCLAGDNETAETVRVDPSIAVRDGLQGDAIDAREARRTALGQARQFPAIPLRQMPPGGADLLFDEIGVVEQPFPRRCDPLLRRDRLRQHGAGLSTSTRWSRPAATATVPARVSAPTGRQTRDARRAAPFDRR